MRRNNLKPKSSSEYDKKEAAREAAGAGSADNNIDNMEDLNLDSPKQGDAQARAVGAGAVGAGIGAASMDPGLEGAFGSASTLNSVALPLSQSHSNTDTENFAMFSPSTVEQDASGAGVHPMSNTSQSVRSSISHNGSNQSTPGLSNWY